MSEYNAKNYTEQGGEKTVIGGILEFTDDAEVLNMPVSDLPIASKDSLGCVKVGNGMGIYEGAIFGYALGGTEIGGPVQGSGLYIDSETYSLCSIIKKVMPNIPNITLATEENLKNGLNRLIAEMIEAGYMMAAD